MLARFLIFFLFLWVNFLSVSAQEITPAKPIICLTGNGTETSVNPSVPLVVATTNQVEVSSATLSFTITYGSTVPAAAKLAIEKAVGIWANYLSSPIPIKLSVTWDALGTNVLAKTGPKNYVSNFTGAIYQNVLYPTALANALSGKYVLNNGDYDIVMGLGSQVNWNYLTDGKPVSGKFDLVSIVLHELAHGLGFTGTFSLNSSNSSQVQWGASSKGSAFDINIQDAYGRLLTNMAIYGNPSTALKTAVTNNALYYGLQNSKYKTSEPKLYAVNTYVDGTSIYHLDETIYPYGNADALMTPYLYSGEVIQTPGNILLYTFSEMGWLVRNFAGQVVTATETTYPTTYDTKIFPNPTVDLLNVAVPNNGKTRNIRIELISPTGEILQSIEDDNILSKTYELNVKQFSSGLYLLRITDGVNVTSKRFMKI